MFWGKNLKKEESYSFDSNKSLIDKKFYITNIRLFDVSDASKYYIKISNNCKKY